MFRFLKQLGSVLLLCTLLLSINANVLADEYQDCITEIKQQAKNLCETFETQLLNECGQTKKFEGTTYPTILDCQEALQNKIDTCISNFEKSNKEPCELLNPANTEAQIAKCIDRKNKESKEYSTLQKLEANALSCQQIAANEHQKHYDQCESISQEECGVEAISDPTCLDREFNGCRRQADREREIKDSKCREKYNEFKTKLSETSKAACEEEFKGTQVENTVSEADLKCGDGTKEKNEECDDGNRDNGDGCNSECKKEAVNPPDVPQISTLVRPDTEKVSKVSPYLSTTFLPRVARTIVSFGIGAAVIGLILGSIGMLTAYGNDEKYSNAKKGVMFSIIGLIICLLAFAIVQLIFFTGFQAGQIKT